MHAGGESFILLTTAETPTQPPQLMERVVLIRDQGGEGAAGEEGPAGEAITALPHPQPALKDVKKELIKYTRALDGLELSGMLYTPAGYDVSRYMTVSYKRRAGMSCRCCTCGRCNRHAAHARGV